MRVNEVYLQTMYVAFGRKTRREIRSCIERIIDSLETMPKPRREAMMEVLNPEVRKAIIVD